MVSLLIWRFEVIKEIDLPDLLNSYDWEEVFGECSYRDWEL